MGFGEVEQIFLPKSLKEIGDFAFALCNSLESIVIPEKIEGLASYTFLGCTMLKTINLPEKLCIISNSVFMGCTSLEEIVIPEGVETIGKGAFSGCSKLKSLEFPKSVKQIGQYGFSTPHIGENEGYISLEEVIFLNPDGIIEGDVFEEHVIIGGYKNSTAQKYAESSGKKFVIISAKDISYHWMLVLIGGISAVVTLGVLYYCNIHKRKNLLENSCKS